MIDYFCVFFTYFIDIFIMRDRPELLSVLGTIFIVTSCIVILYKK